MNRRDRTNGQASETPSRARRGVPIATGGAGRARLAPRAIGPARRGVGKAAARPATQMTTRSRSVSHRGRGAPLRTRETPAQRRARARRILRALRQAYPDAQCALNHRSALELLVATILSAQCTDARVNMVTPRLFARYPDARALADADPAELEELIRPTGFYRNKARALIGVGRMLTQRFGGQVPATMSELLELPGVARKTANCVLGTWFGKNEGIVVDTHVGRIAQRLGLLVTARSDKDAVRIEQDLMQLFPRRWWTWLAHALIQHGRSICTARKPRCDICPLRSDCPSAGRFG